MAKKIDGRVRKHIPNTLLAFIGGGQQISNYNLERRLL